MPLHCHGQLSGQPGPHRCTRLRRAPSLGQTLLSGQLIASVHHKSHLPTSNPHLQPQLTEGLVNTITNLHVPTMPIMGPICISAPTVIDKESSSVILRINVTPNKGPVGHSRTPHRTY